jgi:hypothetical protein
MRPALEYVEGQGHKMIYIYGALDTWYACAVNPSPLVDHLKMVLEDGSHRTRIRSFDDKERQQIYNKLEEWMGVAITPLEN